ncbi:5'-nucleotidase SurE [hydrothermal vent metagenome]|uniref:5'-nucleotidase SurE n=1 Tax=hydrothermal vent metagenome TaxID=652676 RepID=A0A3B0UDA7_9ZZZZ
MRILLSNDDGIDAPGLALLEAAARRLSDDIWVLAPDGKRTAASHNLTCGVPFDIVQRDARHFACTGSPADCVVAAMTHLFAEDQKPDLVVGGINAGRNVAEDAAYSGTLAIAREATFWDIPAIALSRPKTARISDRDAKAVADLLNFFIENMAQWRGEGQFLGVNLPERLPAKIKLARPGRDKIAYRSRIVDTSGARTTLMVPRGRRHLKSDGDQSTALEAGFICVMRYDAFAQAPLAEEFLLKQNTSIG